MATIKQLNRCFRLGSTDLPDPNPDATPEEVLKHYANQYPTLKYGKISAGEPEGDLIVYTMTPNEYRANG